MRVSYASAHAAPSGLGVSHAPLHAHVTDVLRDSGRHSWNRAKTAGQLRAQTGLNFGRSDGMDSASEASDTPEDVHYRCYDWMWAVLKSHYFDLMMGVIIALNAANIGIEQALRLHDQDTSLPSLFENIFLVIYILEFVARICAFGTSCLYDNWIMFDFFVICTGVLLSWVLEPLVGTSSSFGSLMAIRICRLLRLTRLLRLLGRFEELWMMVRGLLQCMNTMCYTLFLLLTMFYIFSVVSLEIITNHELAQGEKLDSDFREVVDFAFDSLPSAMLTMLQFVTFDNLVVIYRPLVEKDWTLAIFFVFGVLIIGIILMNLVTAVIVQGALDQAMQDQELNVAMEQARRRRLGKDMRRMFSRLDKDGSGLITRDEIGIIDEDDKAILKNLMHVADPYEIFDALDLDHSGDLRLDEFIDGIWEIMMSNTPVHIKRMERQIDTIFTEVMERRKVDHMIYETLSKVAMALHVYPNSKGTESDLLSSNVASQPISKVACDWQPPDAEPPSRLSEGRHATAQPTPLKRTASPTEQHGLNGSPKNGKVGKKARALSNWEDDFVSDLQRTCTHVMQQALGDSCRSLLDAYLTPQLGSRSPLTPKEDACDKAGASETRQMNDSARPRILSHRKVPKPRLFSETPSPLDISVPELSTPNRRPKPPSLVFDEMQKQHVNGVVDSTRAAEKNVGAALDGIAET